jgi:DNA repair protein RadC
MSQHLPPRIKDLYLGRYDCLISHISNSKIFHTDQEITLLITLDMGCFEIGEHLMSLGGLNQAQNDVKMFLNRLVSDKASKFIIAHNHPNGVSVFSRDDIRFTIANLILSELMGIQFLDHLLFAFEREPLSMQREMPKIFQRDWMEVFDSSIKKFLPKP